MVEATEQLTRALGHIATLPATRALRREEIELLIQLKLRRQAAEQTEPAEPPEH